jgi:thioesterase domain-containing protein/acyl carrier protein
MSPKGARPQTPEELLIEKIWKKVLNVESVNIDDDFFDIGGTSILAMQLFSEISKTINVNLPTASLFTAPTIKELARIIQKKVHFETNSSIRHGGSKDAIKEDWSTVVAIQPGGDLPPFFCVSGKGGNPVAFGRLSETIGNRQPFYGLQYRGVDGNNKPHESIENIAIEFLKDVRHIQPTGPYYLGGYSLGGLVAYEMAQQLLKNGEIIAGLLLIDAINPEFKKWPLKQRIQSHFSNILSVGPQYIISRIKFNLQKQLPIKRNHTIDQYNLTQKIDLVAESNIRAEKIYKPLPITTDLILIKSTNKLPAQEYGIGVPLHEANGWNYLVEPNRLRVFSVQTHHLNLFTKPFLFDTAQKVTDGLAILREKYLKQVEG